MKSKRKVKENMFGGLNKLPLEDFATINQDRLGMAFNFFKEKKI